MLSDRDTERLAGALMVTSFMLFLGHVVTLLTMGAGRTTIVFVLVYGFPVSLAGLALYRTFRTHEPTLATFAAFGFAAHGLLVVLTAALLLAGLRFPQEFATFGAETGSVTWAASALELSMDKIRSAAFVFLGLGLLPLGVLIAWSGPVARWIGWLGIVAGIVGFFGMLADLSGLPIGRLAGLTRIVALTVFAFMLILGIRLLVRKTQDGGQLRVHERLGSSSRSLAQAHRG